MSFTQIHDLVMYVMVGVLLLSIYVIIERFIFFSITSKEGKKVEDYVTSHLHDKKLHGHIIDIFNLNTSPQAQSICAVAKAAKEHHTNEQMEYLVQSIYVSKKSIVSSRLWILDTVITMSPLLGLLGTILGIIDAFHSLSSGSASADPAAVSRGIGSALYATGFGIFIALFAMMFFNFFNTKVEHINNQMKLISLTVLGAR